MARHLYAPLFVQLAGTAAPAPNLPFRIWSDLTAGTDVTSQCVTTDATAAYNATTDTQGNIAPFRGPDGYVGTLFADTGAAYRFHLYSPTLIADLITGLANAGTGGGGGTALTSYVNQVASLLDYPASFPPKAHTHITSDVTDTTTTGKALMTASSADAALTTVGGVKNSGGVTSLRTVTSTTAALSNGVPTLPVVSGQILFVYSG